MIDMIPGVHLHQHRSDRLPAPPLRSLHDQRRCLLPGSLTPPRPARSTHVHVLLRRTRANDPLAYNLPHHSGVQLRFCLESGRLLCR